MYRVKRNWPYSTVLPKFDVYLAYCICSNAVRGDPERKSFARGLRIEMELDEDQFTGGGAFLFATVLERFFGLAASLNSFTQLSVTTRQRKEGLHEWEPRSGRRLLV